MKFWKCDEPGDFTCMICFGTGEYQPQQFDGDENDPLNPAFRKNGLWNDRPQDDDDSDNL